MLHHRVDELERRLARVERKDPPVRRRGGAPRPGDAPGRPAVTERRAPGRDPAGALQWRARSVAMQMLVSGCDPAEVAEYLRENFGVEDPEPLIRPTAPPPD